MKQFTELKNSPYIYETDSGVKFAFSTRIRKERFEKTYLQNRKEMKNSGRRGKVYVDFGGYFSRSFRSDFALSFGVACSLSLGEARQGV